MSYTLYKTDGSQKLGTARRKVLSYLNRLSTLAIALFSFCKPLPLRGSHRMQEALHIP